MEEEHAGRQEAVILGRFLRRAVEFYDKGLASCESLVDYLRLIGAALDESGEGTLRDILAVLDEAWRESDG